MNGSVVKPEGPNEPASHPLLQRRDVRFSDRVLACASVALMTDSPTRTTSTRERVGLCALLAVAFIAVLFILSSFGMPFAVGR
jgi:hypothetical protein